MQPRLVCYLSIVVAEAAFNQLNQCVHCCLLIGTISDDTNICTAYDTQRQNTQQALCIYSAFLLFDPDRGLELICLLDEECCRSCVQTNLILNCYVFHKHNHTLPSLRYKVFAFVYQCILILYIQKSESSTVFRNICKIFAKILRFAKTSARNRTACLYIITTNNYGEIYCPYHTSFNENFCASCLITLPIISPAAQYMSHTDRGVFPV